MILRDMVGIGYKDNKRLNFREGEREEKKEKTADLVYGGVQSTSE